MPPRIIPKVKVKGVRELRRAFDRLPAKLARKAINQSIRASLKSMVVRIKASIKDKALAKQIKVRAWPKRRRNVIALEIRVGDKNLSPEEWKALKKREFGTKDTPAEPSFRPAFDTLGPSSLREAKALILAGVEREAKS